MTVGLRGLGGEKTDPWKGGAQEVAQEVVCVHFNSDAVWTGVTCRVTLS